MSREPMELSESQVTALLELCAGLETMLVLQKGEFQQAVAMAAHYPPPGGLIAAAVPPAVPLEHVEPQGATTLQQVERRPLSESPIVQMLIGYLPWDVQNYVWSALNFTNGMKMWKIAFFVVAAMAAAMATGHIKVPDVLTKDFMSYVCPAPVKIEKQPELHAH